MTEQDTSPHDARWPMIVRDLRHTYRVRGRSNRGQIVALRDVSLRIADRSLVALLGPNGSGKSTFMRICSGLLEADSGSVLVNGNALGTAARRDLGVVFQSPGLDPHMTVSENLKMAGKLTGMSRSRIDPRISEVLERLQLADRRHSRVKSLSGGLARRADLCRALLHEPSILLLDEPTTGLDPRARRQFLDLLQMQREEYSLTILMSTHLIEEAEQADRVIMMDNGSIVADDTPDALRHSIGQSRMIVHSIAWTPPDDQWTLTADGWLRRILPDSDDRRVLCEALLNTGLPFSFEPPSLDDVFLKKTGHTIAGAGGDT